MKYFESRKLFVHLANLFYLALSNASFVVFPQLQNFILKFVEITLRLIKGMKQTLLTKSLLAMNLVILLQSLARNSTPVHTVK